jgi:type III secretion system YscQ/HrcQ family protein
VNVRAFPLDRLSKLSRSQLPLLRRVARAAIAIDHELLRDLLGAEIAIEGALVREATAVELVDPLVAILLEHESGSRAALEIEPRLAAVVVDRILGGDAKTVGPVVDLPNPVEAGALLYAAARALRGHGRWFVRDVYVEAALVRDAIGASALCQRTFRIAIGADAGLARLWLREDLPANAAAPSGLAPSFPIAMSVIAARGHLAPADLAALGPGDLVLLDETFVRALGPLDGCVEVRPAGSSARFVCELRGRDLVVIDSHEAAIAVTRGRTMKEDPMKDAMDSLADVPIELTVEVARFSMSLAEVSRLKPGEVVASGRGLGEAVVLRAHDRVIATGELVDVDGEIGVRVLALG